MIAFVLMVSVAVAGDNLLVRPSPPDAQPTDCSRSLSITKGEPAPPEVFTDGVALCNAVIEPTSSLAYLLALEKYERASAKLHAVDVELLKSQRDWYKVKYEETAQPPKWIDKPSTQRWLGRLEMLATVGLVASGASIAYKYTKK